MLWQALAIGPELQAGALILGLAIAVILHEVAHGYAALRLGDPTAYYAGRLTLNPVKHIDLWGTILIPGFLILAGSGFVIGWAKPVPVNYYNLRGGRWGPLLVAIAGPATNLMLLAFFGWLVRLSPAGTALPYLFYTVAVVNGVLMLFNLIPIPPLDGSKVLYVFLDQRPEVVQWLEQYGLYLMIGVLLFGQSLLQYLVFHPALALVRFFAGPLLF
ncbi:MAG: site-2 protease family protein [Candidatus Andersenbacteria bacterium]|nr:site-2 protease family protein [Candidatus Andersenbacteria bacterium]